MRASDIVSGLVLLAVGLFTLVIVIPAEISGHSAYGISPDFFPRLLTLLFIGFATLLVLNRSLAHFRGKPLPESQEPPLHMFDWAFIAAVTVFLVVTFVIMKYVGFVAAGVFAILVAAAAMGSLWANPVRMVALSLLAPLAVFYAFKELFYVFLPS